MEYVQERITTLHAFGEAGASGVEHPPLDRVGVIVPLSGRDCESPAADRVFSTLAAVDPGHVIVPVDAPTERISRIVDWIDGFALDVTVLWCNADSLGRYLRDHGLGEPTGKGRDVWLALGAMLDRPPIEYVVIHDADARSYSGEVVRRLVWPLAAGHGATKGYYARIEDRCLYGRLFRLLYAPLLRAIGEGHPAPIVRYLSAFRYALAGEIAMTTAVAGSVRPHPGWGFETGMLGEWFDHVGRAGTAQVDLGVHRHDHRDVDGPAGLSSMAEAVASAVFRSLERNGLAPDYDDLRGRYRECGRTLVEQYAADARFNGLSFDAASEIDQVERYAGAIQPPGPDPRLPAWESTAVDASAVLEHSAEAIEPGRPRG